MKNARHHFKFWIRQCLVSTQNSRAADGAQFWEMKVREVIVSIMGAAGSVDDTWTVCLEEAGPWLPKRDSSLAPVLQQVGVLGQAM